MENTNSNVHDIVDLASQIQPVEIVSHEHMKRVALPPGWEMEQINNIELLPAPPRKKGGIILEDVNSFINYINRHKIDGQTTIYCTADYVKSDISMLCVINDHAGDANGQQWRDHVARYTPRFSEEWNRWTGNNLKTMSQLDMAMFIERNLQDVTAADGYPTGQQLLEMATSFQAVQDMRFKSAIRTQNGGINMSFIQDDDTQTLSQMKMFEKIAIGIPVFWNGDAYQITARLRYRAREAKLTFEYELIRHDKILEDATKNIIEKVTNSTGVPFYFGSI